MVSIRLIGGPLDGLEDHRVGAVSPSKIRYNLASYYPDFFSKQKFTDYNYHHMVVSGDNAFHHVYTHASLRTIHA